jgi:hypothetical protein
MHCVSGGEQTRGGQVAIDTLAWIYEHWIPADKVIKTNTWSSELSKLVQRNAHKIWQIKFIGFRDKTVNLPS